MMQQSQQNMQLIMNQSNQNMQAMTQMIQAIASKPEPAPQQFGLQEMMALMVSMKELTPKSPDPMDLFLKGAEFGQNSGGGDENILQTAVKSLAPGLTAMANMAAPKPQTNQPSIQKQEKSHQNPHQNQMSEEDMKIFDQLKEMQPAIAMLVGAAVQNADTDVYANFILDQFGLEKTQKFIGNDAMYEKLFIFIPQAAPHRQWFDQVRAGVIHYITEANNGGSGNVLEQTADGLRDAGTVPDVSAKT